MDPQRNIALSLFDSFSTSVTGGLIPDLQTAMFAVAGLFLILLAFDIIVRLITGASASERVSDWWSETGSELDYQEYRKKRLKNDYQSERYAVEKYNRLNKGTGITWDAPKRSEYK